MRNLKVLANGLVLHVHKHFLRHGLRPDRVVLDRAANWHAIHEVDSATSTVRCRNDVPICACGMQYASASLGALICS